MLLCVATVLSISDLSDALAVSSDTLALRGRSWIPHLIDGDGQGADGTRLGDINRDGWVDIVTGWEKDGTTRLYLNPGPAGVKGRWPRVIVGDTPDVEDAILVDVDGDGRLDVVSSTEGDSRRILVHWGPTHEHLLERDAWQQADVTAVSGMTRWMFAEHLRLEGQHGISLVIGGRRGSDSRRSWLGLLQTPAAPRATAHWTWAPLVEMEWTMTIHVEDMDADGDPDILFSDKLGLHRGVHWLENPGIDRSADSTIWKQHRVGAETPERVMLLGVGDLDGDGLRDVLAPVSLRPVDKRAPQIHGRLVWLRRLDVSGRMWEERVLAIPAGTGNLKHVAIGDIDGDSRSDLVISCEHADGVRVGLYWLKGGDLSEPAWSAFDISGSPGTKFDLVHLLDLDDDGDLDVLTTEEKEGAGGLGVIWYENPAH